MGTNNLGEILHQRREEKGITLVKLSGESGVSLTHIDRIEKGKRFPSARILRKLANPLGFSEIELFKLAGFLSRDAVDDRLDKFKQEIKREIAAALLSLYKKIDSF